MLPYQLDITYQSRIYSTFDKVENWRRRKTPNQIKKISYHKGRILGFFTKNVNSHHETIIITSNTGNCRLLAIWRPPYQTVLHQELRKYIKFSHGGKKNRKKGKRSNSYAPQRKIFKEGPQIGSGDPDLCIWTTPASLWPQGDDVNRWPRRAN